ncbi:MAG: pilus assembly protein PilP [Myxococcaceae bacterium]|nr:pilus assembly protein PilP [Myxococcaceae bacterium]
MRRHLLHFLFAAAATAVACSDPPPPPPPAVRPPPPKAETATPDAGLSTEVRYIYNPVGKRDPFRTPLEDTPASRDQAAQKLCSDPLCQLDLDQLTLVAVVTGDADPVAMVEDSSHIGFIVRRGTRIGKQGGKVTQVSRDCVEITEFFQTPDGKSNPNKVSLCVKNDATRSATLDLLNNRNVE